MCIPVHFRASSPDNFFEVPNDPVDMSSWGSSACYPWRTFDPLRESPSTRYFRITKTDFRLCSTCMSRSQASFYFYALRCMSDAPELTFMQLWYSFRVRRPS